MENEWKMADGKWSYRQARRQARAIREGKIYIVGSPRMKIEALECLSNMQILWFGLPGFFAFRRNRHWRVRRESATEPEGNVVIRPQRGLRNINPHSRLETAATRSGSDKFLVARLVVRGSQLNMNKGRRVLGPRRKGPSEH